jgi:hypothetical protein
MCGRWLQSESLVGVMPDAESANIFNLNMAVPGIVMHQAVHTRRQQHTVRCDSASDH